MTQAAYLVGRAAGWNDANAVGAARADVGTGHSTQIVVEADFDRGEIVVATAEGKAFARDGGVGTGELREEIIGRGRGLTSEADQAARNSNGVQGGTGVGEKGLRWEAGAGAVGGPLVTKQAGVGVEVAEGGGIGRTSCVGAVLGIGTVVVLRPETVEDEAGTGGALRLVGVGGTELRRPGEIEQIEIEDAGLVRGVLVAMTTVAVIVILVFRGLIVAIVILSAPLILPAVPARGAVALVAVIVAAVGNARVCRVGGGLAVVADVPGDGKHRDEDEKGEQALVHGVSNDTLRPNAKDYALRAERWDRQTI